MAKEGLNVLCPLGLGGENKRVTQDDTVGSPTKRQKTQELERIYEEKFWGPYLSDRQWGTVREDKSCDYSCWDDLTHDDAARTVYLWGEDGLMGVSDRENKLCAGLALWNGQDDMLKERLFGLTNPQGNHGEDVKEIYCYLDNTPNHTYMKSQYRYPMSQFPYRKLIDENAERTETDCELEIQDTGVFSDNDFWDVYTEYSTDIPGSILCRYTIHNRSNYDSSLYVLPQFWFRNTWFQDPSSQKPQFECLQEQKVKAKYQFGEFEIEFSRQAGAVPEVLMTENEDVFTSQQPYLKDGFHQYLIHGESSAVKKEGFGTKCCAVYDLVLPPGAQQTLYWSLYPKDGQPCLDNLPMNCDAIITKRSEEADVFYNSILPVTWDKEEGNIARQACAGLLWSKQYYSYNVQKQWKQVEQSSHRKSAKSISPKREISQDDEANKEGKSYLKNKEKLCQELGESSHRTGDPRPIQQDHCAALDEEISHDQRIKTLTSAHSHKDTCEMRKEMSSSEVSDKMKEQISDTEQEAESIRRWNPEWGHFDAHDILSVPDKWEFPWFASWDTGFQMIPFSRLDPNFAKNQLLLLLSERYMSPPGQMPGCEFNLSDMCPPIHAWACLKVYKITGSCDLHFLESCYTGLKQHYEWVRSTKSVGQKFTYTGGFLGLDNISVIDRSNPPTGTILEQADATGWMALFSLNMLEISLELSKYHPELTRDSISYISHFLDVSKALNDNTQDGGLWHEEDKFYYDVLETSVTREVIRLRSLVGLVPTFACMVISNDCNHNVLTYLKNIFKEGSQFVWRTDDHYVLSAVPPDRLQHVLTRVFSRKEFLSPFGIRSLSKVYEDSPYEMLIDKKTYTVTYNPRDSDSGMFGGNSNWRGPVWLCMNYMVVEMLKTYYGSLFTVQTDEGEEFTLNEGVQYICKCIRKLFLPDKSGVRPFNGNCEQTDPLWRDILLFNEYFNGDTGKGHGASHQTGWTSLIIEFLFKIKR